MYYDDKSFEIIAQREVGDKIYYDILLLPERNVELNSLHPITELKENEYAIYSKNNFIEIVYINKIDRVYEYAFIQIYKSNVPINFLNKK